MHDELFLVVVSPQIQYHSNAVSSCSSTTVYLLDDAIFLGMDLTRLLSSAYSINAKIYTRVKHFCVVGISSIASTELVIAHRRLSRISEATLHLLNLFCAMHLFSLRG